MTNKITSAIKVREVISIKQKFLFPKWVWLFGFLGWFSAEVVTVSTVFNKIDLSTFIFSFSYYLVQLAIVADIISRKKLSILGIFLVGLLYGILEEAFYIKNPLFLTLLLALGHSAVTVTFPYLLTNFLVPGEKQPFLSKKGYILAILYLATLYIFMARFIPFIYPDSLILGSVLMAALLLFIKRSGRTESLVVHQGLKGLEMIALIIFASLVTISSQQNYSGVILILVWLVTRGRVVNLPNLYLFTYLFLIFHFLASFINKSIDPSKIAINYVVSLIIGLILIFLLWKKRQYAKDFLGVTA